MEDKEDEKCLCSQILNKMFVKNFGYLDRSEYHEYLWDKISKMLFVEQFGHLDLQIDDGKKYTRDELHQSNMKLMTHLSKKIRSIFDEITGEYL